MPEPAETIHLTVNGEVRSVTPFSGQLLVELVRDGLDLKASHFGCLTGDCGACTMLVDGVATKSCLLLAAAMDRRSVVTPEGDRTPETARLRAEFVANNAFQCGFCTPGMLVAASDLLRRVPHPTTDEIRWAIGGNLCRCTGYEPIIRAIAAAARQQEQT